MDINIESGFYQVVEFCLEDSTERSESNPGRSLGIITIERSAVWKTVPTHERSIRFQSDQSAFGKILSGETNTDYKDITDFIRWYCLPDSCFIYHVNPETLSRVTLALLGIGFQPKLLTDNPRPNTNKRQPYFYLLIFYHSIKPQY